LLRNRREFRFPGSNTKAKLATKSVFALAHKHGDILRDGWKNILERIS
jgi:brefeldin A-resistance guanine nucleotide exchange factor 1